MGWLTTQQLEQALGSQESMMQDRGLLGSDIQEVTITDLISEGPIEGLVHGEGSVYLEGDPLEDKTRSVFHSPFVEAPLPTESYGEPALISVPAASAGENPERTIGEIVVNVKKEGGIIIEGIERTELETLEMFKSIVAAYPDQALILRGDKEASFDHIVKVLNLCKEANIWNISFATSQPENTN